MSVITSISVPNANAFIINLIDIGDPIGIVLGTVPKTKKIHVGTRGGGLVGVLRI